MLGRPRQKWADANSHVFEVSREVSSVHVNFIFYYTHTLKSSFSQNVIHGRCFIVLPWILLPPGKAPPAPHPGLLGVDSPQFQTKEAAGT